MKKEKYANRKVLGNIFKLFTTVFNISKIIPPYRIKCIALKNVRSPALCKEGAAGSTALQSPLGLLSLRPLSHKLPEGYGDSHRTRCSKRKFRRGMVLPSDASVLSHVFWKAFRKLLNQQAFKLLHRINLPFNLFILRQSSFQALFGVELWVSTLIYIFENF
uniref:Uncharacterized protein n=1 Tax=Myotis myotis TaxID=51298 RepID=A0A7J7ZYT9_MYOMY|nr:hypothetical protein mMyoMyo1_009908 [Myotis myotis]